MQDCERLRTITDDAWRVIAGDTKTIAGETQLYQLRVASGPVDRSRVPLVYEVPR
jgi:hypothetical protein